MKLNRRTFVLICTTLFAVTSVAHAHANEPAPFEDMAPIHEFIDEMVTKHKFDASELKSIFTRARRHQSILDAISRPAESKPWYQYRPIFMTRERVRGGVLFWNEHTDIIARAAQEFRVAPEILVAIVGVETRYGKHTGNYPVLDSLATLAFAYPPRARFFRSELEQYLLMTREESLDPLEQKGSYAGAMGMPQFISSSFRHYAVDFDGDGHRNLWDNTADAIGSVANYFKKHGWKQDQPVTHKVKVSGLKYRELIDTSLKPPRHSPDDLRLAGVALPDGLPDGLKGSLLELDSGDGPEYWVTWHNFYVISRYNRSALYSMAVYQLSQEIVNSR